jgi:hypothetical protein
LGIQSWLSRRARYFGFLLVLLTLMLATTAVTAQATNKIIGGTGGGYVICDNFQFTSSVSVYFSWLPDYTQDRYGNPLATYIRPYQGDIFLKDPHLGILDDCGPLTWTNRAYFDGGKYQTSTPLGGGNYTCTAWIYDPYNTDHRGGCQYTYYYGVPYNSTYGYGNVYFGATIYPYSGFFGAFSGKTGTAKL